MDVVHAFCEATGLSVNVQKTKVMSIRTHNVGNQPMVMYQDQAIEVVDSFKYLGVDIPSNHAWGSCVRSRLDAGKAKYYQFENMCKQSTIQRWEIKAMVFEACVVQTILYGVEVWGASISASTWNEIEKIQKKFLCRHLGVKSTTPYSVMLLETGNRPLEMKALQRMYKYIVKVKMMPTTRIPHMAWDVGCAPQKTNKSKFLSSSLVQDIKKWFARWNVEAYVDMPIEAGKEGDSLLNFELTALNSLHNKWKTAPHKSKFEYYCKHIHTKYWETYKMSETQIHIRTAMCHRARRAITMMRTRSHMLKMETGGWLKIDASKRECTQCSLQRPEDETHVTLECPAYAHIRADFQQLTHGCTSFEELLSKTDPSPTVLGIYLASILEHHTLLMEKAKDTTYHSPPQGEPVSSFAGPMGHFGPPRT